MNLMLKLNIKQSQTTNNESILQVMYKKFMQHKCRYLYLYQKFKKLYFLDLVSVGFLTFLLNILEKQFLFRKDIEATSFVVSLNAIFVNIVRTCYFKSCIVFLQDIQQLLM